MHAFSVENLNCSYPDRRAGMFRRPSADAVHNVLSNITFTTEPGELLVILGEGGAGKSTLLRAMAGLLKPLSGRILENGRDITAIPPHLRDMAMVFQNFSLYPRMTVAENLAFPLKGGSFPLSEIQKRVEETAGTLGLSEKLGRYAPELSGGELQRVALGRALIRKPKLFLLDEPLTNLDAKLREQMQTYIRRLQKYLQTTLLFVTHDAEEAMGMADRVMVMRKGEVMQIAAPEEIYRNPANSYVAGILGSPVINLLAPEEASRWGLPDNSGRILGVRPEHVTVTASLQGRARVRVCQHLGHALVLTVERDEVRLRALVEPFSGLKEGDAVDVNVDFRNILLLEPR